MKWIGNGVLRHKKKIYGYGDELPDDLDEKTIKRFMDSGLVGDILEPPQAVNRVAELETELLEQAKQHAEEIDSLNAETKRLKAEVKKCKKAMK